MEKFIITGGKKLFGEVSVSGSKNVALKALVAACLTCEEVTIHNIPLISDFFIMTEIIEELGGKVIIDDHTAKITMETFKTTQVFLDKAATIRTSVMFLAPLLARVGEAIIPNPGGCRIGARPIDRVVEGLKKMGVSIRYKSKDGYFYAKTKNKERLKGTSYIFEKNTHTGTETLILASVLSEGKTFLENAAQEPEVDELIKLLSQMGARIYREDRKIVIEGVEKLHGTSFTIGPDRNEIVTFAIAAIITGGDISVRDAHEVHLSAFLEKFTEAGGKFEQKETGIRFFGKGQLKATNITTSAHPGFMTDWQGPWAVLMTKAHGVSIIHETVYENRFGYIDELRKMGAHIELFNPVVEDPKTFYNFNQSDDNKEFRHGARIIGPVRLHNGVVTISDLRAGATIVLGALAASGTSIVFGIEHVDRGYEEFEKRLKGLGAIIQRVSV